MGSWAGSDLESLWLPAVGSMRSARLAHRPGGHNHNQACHKGGCPTTGSEFNPFWPGDITEAADLVGQGQHIKFDQPDQVTLLMDKMREMPQEAGKYDACKVHVPNTNLFCVDAETEILTADGWRRYATLRPGDEVLTLDHETGLSQWQPCSAVNVFAAEERLVLSIEHRFHSSITTADHRWPTVAPTRSGGKVVGCDRRWRTSATLTQEDRFVVAAPCVDLPTEAKYEDALVELVAWTYTEGCQTSRTTLYVCQSGAVNPAHVVAIRRALVALYGPAYEGDMRGLRGLRLGKAKEPRPAWRETTHENGVVYFHLNAAASGPILAHLDQEKVVSPSFLRSLTLAQLGLFIERSLDADGAVRERLLDGRRRATLERVFSQRSQARTDSFVLACVLAGLRVNLSEAPERRPDRLSGLRQYVASISTKSPTVAPLLAAASGQGTAKVQWVTHGGIVWCPTTPNGTWLARRRGTLWFTGNCAGHLDITRTAMPQLKAIPTPGSRATKGFTANDKGEVDLSGPFRTHMERQGYAVTEESVPVSHLRATQMDAEGQKVAGIMQAMRDGKVKATDPVFVTSDNYIIDGHHRVFANAALDAESGTTGTRMQSVIRVHAPISEVLWKADEFASYMGMPRSGIGTFNPANAPPAPLSAASVWQTPRLMRCC